MDCRPIYIVNVVQTSSLRPQKIKISFVSLFPLLNSFLLLPMSLCWGYAFNSTAFNHFMAFQFSELSFLAPPTTDRTSEGLSGVVISKHHTCALYAQSSPHSTRFIPQHRFFLQYPTSLVTIDTIPTIPPHWQGKTAQLRPETNLAHINSNIL